MVLALVLGAITVIFGTIYVVQQQSLRIGSNDPQIQIAEDTATALDNGSTPESLTKGKVDMSASLALFVIIYDKSGNVVSGNGYLDGKIPSIPFGSLEHSKGKEYSFVTWQPKSDVRISSITVSAKNYYILSGRSLKEIEKRVDSLLNYVAFGWVCSILLVLLAAMVYPKNPTSKKNES